MTVDQITGDLHFVFYDRRNHNDNHTDVYGAISRDGGETFFLIIRLVKSHFYPAHGYFFGDYNNISAHDNVIRPIWTRMHNNQLSIWTAIIDDVFG